MIQRNQLSVVSRQRSHYAGMGHNHGDLGGGQHHLQARTWGLGIERQIRAPRFENRQGGEGKVGGGGQAQTHHAAWFDAQTAQVMRQLVGALLQLLIAKTLGTGGHSQRVGGDGGLALYQIRHTKRR